MKIARGKSNVRSSIDIWDNMYSQGQSLFLYPDSTFVSLSHRLLKLDNHPKVLDYSFGHGSNMISMLKRGFDVSGVEVSRSAINLVRGRLKKERLNAELKLFQGIKLPYADNTFNAVIAWGVLYYNTWESLGCAVKEIERVLKPGGLFMGTMPTPNSGFRQNATPLGNCLYRLKTTNQKGIVTIVVDKRSLHKCFPFRRISIGKFGFEYKNMETSHWIVTYEKK